MFLDNTGGILRFRYSTEENGKIVKKAAVYTQTEHNINFSDVDPHAVSVARELQSKGYETYIVGGAVRDLILGKNPKDFDIATSASPARIKKIFRNSRIIGRRFRLVHVFFGSKIIEVSTFRSLKDGSAGNTFGSIDEDVQRRDFTFNALFYDPVKQLVVDYVEGINDIKKRLVRPIIPLPEIFTDDPVRMIRAVKYAAATGFKLPLYLKWSIKKNSMLLEGVSSSRLTEEIFKIIHSPYAHKIIDDLDNLALFKFLQPKTADLFKSVSGFRNKYLKTFAALKGETVSEAEIYAALIKDYLDLTLNWDLIQGENFKDVFNLVRKFVLPMNPPKVNLYNAIRLIFAQHGIPVKKYRLKERIRYRRKPKKVKGENNG